MRAASIRARGWPASSPSSSSPFIASRLVGALTDVGGGFSYMHFSPVQSVVDPGAGVPVDGAEFRLPADGDGPAAQRGRRSRAARRSHRRRQPPPSAAAPDRRMRALGAQRPAVRAAGDRSRRLQGHQRHPRPRRRRRLPAAFHPDGANPAAARRHAGADRRRRVLHRAAVLDAARRRDDRAPRAGSLPRGRRTMHRHRYSDRGLDRRRAMDPRDGRIPRPPDRGRRPCALRRQEGRPQRLCDLRPGAAAGARTRKPGVSDMALRKRA